MINVAADDIVAEGTIVGLGAEVVVVTGGSGGGGNVVVTGGTDTDVLVVVDVLGGVEVGGGILSFVSMAKKKEWT